MRASFLLFVAAVLVAPACSSDSSANNPATPTAPAASFAGTWGGSATDSTGSLAGSGLGNLATMTWVLTQTGSQVTGVMSFTGFPTTPSQAAATVSGTVSGSILSFTATLPATSMPSPNSACSATANGTLTLDAGGNSVTGTYSGTSSCVGAFTNGQIALTRQ